MTNNCYRLKNNNLPSNSPNAYHALLMHFKRFMNVLPRSYVSVATVALEGLGCKLSRKKNCHNKPLFRKWHVRFCSFNKASLQTQGSDQCSRKHYVHYNTFSWEKKSPFEPKWVISRASPRATLASRAFGDCCSFLLCAKSLAKYIRSWEIIRLRNDWGLLNESFGNIKLYLQHFCDFQNNCNKLWFINTILP